MLSENGTKKLTNLILFAFSLVPIVLYLFIVVQRVNFPFDVEWGEGAALNQVNHILSGQTLYEKPSIRFSPLVYTPVYFYASAAVALIADNGLLALRLVSVISSIGSTFVIFWIVRKETGNNLAGWISGALFLACFELSNGFYDLARVDSLYIFILLLTLGAYLSAKKKAGLVAAGILCALGFLTKQSAVIVFIPLMLYSVIWNFKRDWPFLISTTIGIGVPILILSKISNGWFGYYVFQLPKEHGWSFVDAINFWVGDTLRPLGIAMGFLVLYFIIRIINWKKTEIFKTKNMNSREKAGWFSVDNHLSYNKEVIYLLFVVGSFIAAWITRSSNGGGSNNCLSAYASVAIVFGMGYDLAMKQIKEFKGKIPSLYISLVVILQLIGLIYNPFNYIPTPADLKVSIELLDLIQDAGGKVLIPFRSHLPGLVDKETNIHVVNLFELSGYFHGDIQAEGREIIDELRAGICEQKYAAIILDQPIPWIEEQINNAYSLSTELRVGDLGNRSQVMLWQDGINNTYFPNLNRDLEGCFENY